MARELDRQAASGTEIRVYWLEHADAEKLLPVLQQLVGQAGATAAASAATATVSAAGAAVPAGAPVSTPVASGGSGNGIASRSEEHTSELQSLMRISYAVFCLKKKKQTQKQQHIHSKSE